MGREGSSPRELSRFANQILVGPNDSLFVPDPRDCHVTIFAVDGQVGRVISMAKIPLGKS
ncbi:MAG: hypothetical protein ABIT38_11695 [Gemmatimonadaceae bacterium]